MVKEKDIISRIELESTDYEVFFKSIVWRKKRIRGYADM